MFGTRITSIRWKTGPITCTQTSSTNGRRSPRSASIGRFPEIEPWETDFGIAFNTKYKDGKNGRHYVVMPLAAFIMIAEEGLDHLVDHLAFRIPIDDKSHRSFIVNLFEIFGEERDRYMEKRRLRQAALQRSSAARRNRSSGHSRRHAHRRSAGSAGFGWDPGQRRDGDASRRSAIAMPISSAAPTARQSCYGRSTLVKSRRLRKGKP